MIADPSANRAALDLDDPEVVYGQESGRWRIVSFSFPTLDFFISATEPDGAVREYGFRVNLSQYPAAAPEVRIWDFETNGPLPVDRRPKGGQRVLTTFQKWGSDTVYRPWDRMTGPHNENATKFPQLAWHSERRLIFILEDLYGILNSNAVAACVRSDT